MATEGSTDLVLAMEPGTTTNPNRTWTLLSVSDGQVRRAQEELGECRSAAALIACAQEESVTVFAGENGSATRRKFTSIGPGLGTPVNDRVIPLVADYHRGALTGAFAIDAEARVWQGELPGRLLALSDRYAVVDVSFTHTWSDRIAVYEVAR